MMHSYTRLMRYAVPYWAGWTGIGFVTLLSTVFSLLQPWPMKVLVDHVLGDQPMTRAVAAAAGWLPGSGSTLGLLAWVVAATLGIFAVNSLVDVILTLEWTRVGRRMVYDLAGDVFAAVQRRSIQFHTRNPIGDLLSRITGDTWSVHTVVDTLLLGPGHALVMLVMMVVVMAQLDPGLTLLSLGVAPFMSASAWLFGRPIRTAARARREVESRIHSHVQQTMAGIPVVQAFTCEDVEEARFRTLAAESIRADQQSAFIGSSYGLASGLVSTLGTAAILWMAAMRVLDGRLTLGTTLVFLSYLTTLQHQLAAFANTYTTIQDAGASVDRVLEVLEPRDDLRETPRAVPLRRVAGHVRMQGVTVGYQPGEPVLRDVSIEVRPGETVAIVGETGAGKSTLVSLLPRFIDPWAGCVLVDRHNVREVQLDTLRAQIAIVLQDAFLFPLTIADNIAYGRPDARRDEIEAAARAASAHEFIASLPEGYDTVIGERGVTLSGGERQRIAVARALVKDAPVLILDEPTSALDSETERALLQALDRLMVGRTTLIIAHRLSTIRRASRIVVLDRGRVVEEGTHPELLRRGGPYARLHDLQFGRAAAGATAV